MSVITLERKVLEKNDAIADELRAQFNRRNIFVLNFISSPGSGKTSLLEATIRRLKRVIRIGVIEGDVQTNLDAERIDALGVPVVQIVTHGGCHLEAALVRDAYATISAHELDLLVIENVGNLVCPAGFDLGEEKKVVLISTTEGDDKPLKYPKVFRNASICIVNKIDLLPYVNCEMDRLHRNALAVNPELQLFDLSCTTGDGIEAWCEWLSMHVTPR